MACIATLTLAVGVKAEAAELKLSANGLTANLYTDIYEVSRLSRYSAPQKWTDPSMRVVVRGPGWVYSSNGFLYDPNIDVWVVNEYLKKGLPQLILSSGRPPTSFEDTHVYVEYFDRDSVTTYQGNMTVGGVPMPPPIPSCDVSAQSIDLGTLDSTAIQGVTKTSTVTVRCSSTASGTLTAVGQNNQQTVSFSGNPRLKGILRVNGATAYQMTAGPYGNSTQWSVKLDDQGAGTLSSGTYTGVAVLRFTIN
ncbi:hypothetical protein BLX41_31730 [Pseudomonas protegens]|nr:hypothetical protein BLX41_31730 [Pseudomonas protegens]